MRNLLLCLSLVSLIACKACGQVSFREITTLAGAKNATIDTDGVIVIDSDSKLQVGTALEFKYDNSYKFSQVIVKKDGKKFDVSGTSFRLTDPGKYEITVALFDPDKGIFLDSYAASLGSVPPDPNPGPDPKPVPPDEFGNIGQRVALWSTGLTKRKEVAAIYRAGAVRLKDDLKATVNIVTADMKDKQASTLGAAYSSYADMFSKINADLNSRWPMTKGTLADYCTAIALGLESQ